MQAAKYWSRCTMRQDFDSLLQINLTKGRAGCSEAQKIKTSAGYV